ncbi:hypothetical protein ACLMJK_006442 [Lecanora helva]
MAPIGDAYFPPLDRCLSGEQQLLSWKTTYLALSQPDHGVGNASLRRHLADPQTIRILTHAYSPFQTANSQTKSSFETKTSAVNAAPSPDANYDIKQIQEDTLWLSKQTKIDEVSALRITILELQTRSILQLLQSRDVGQSVYNQEDGGVGTFRASALDPGSSIFANATSQGQEPSKTSGEGNARHRRLLEIYLSERRSILKCSEYLIFFAFSKAESLHMSPQDQRKDRYAWLEDVGAEVLSSWITDESAQSQRKHPVVEAVDTLRARLKGLSMGSGWLQDMDMQEDIELAWLRNQILEMIHVMQITLNLLMSSAHLVKASAILSWFRLMKDCEFYDNLQLPPELQTAYGIPLVSLPALISLAILNIPSTLELLERSASTANTTSSGDNIPYILHGATVNEINDILIALAQLKPASPAVMAWAVITKNLRDTAVGTRESREARQSLRAADKYGAAESSDTDSPVHSSMRRGSSVGSDASQQSTLLEEIYDAIAFAVVDGNDSVAFLASNAASDGGVFEVVTAIAVEYCTPFGFEHEGKLGQSMRGVLLSLIAASVDYVDYTPLLLTAILAIISGSERYWEAFDRLAGANSTEPAAIFLHDKALTHKLYFISMLHFPHESLPFLELCRALAFANNGSDHGGPAMWTILEDADSFTCSLPSKEFQAYVSTNMQEEADFIELTEDFHVAIAQDSGTSMSSQSTRMPRAITKSSQTTSLQTIPSRTSGKLMNGVKPFVVAWHQSYSPLTYMGKVLQAASTAGDLSHASGTLLTADIVGEMIGLIVNMLSSAIKITTTTHASTSSIESVQVILGLSSEGLGRNQDIVSVILDIYEKELYKPRRTSEDFESMEILVQCSHFTFALLQVMPDRVWPFLGRSGLLGIGQDESQLRSIVATQEMITGRYDFLLSCIRLFESLVADVIIYGVSRKAPSKALTRFGSVISGGAGVSQTTIEKVLLNLTRTMIETFEGTMKWRFLEQEDRMEINFRLCSIFQKILKVYYGMDNEMNSSQKQLSALGPAADYIVDVFLSRSSTDVTILPLLHIFTEGVATRITTLPVRGLQYWTCQVNAALKLSNTLVRVNRLLSRQSSQLEDQLFEATSTLVRVYAAHDDYKVSVVALFESLVSYAAETSQQPPSLLGHLGEEDSSHFLDALSVFDQPLNNDELFCAIWKLLSAVVSKRQQWFAIFILTGNTPRESFKNKADQNTKSKRPSEPVLRVALDALSNINKLDTRKALNMLEFVVLAADFWPWVLGTIEKHNHFLKAISEYAAHIATMATTSREQSYRMSADYLSIRVASLAADLLSMYIRYTQESGNQKFAKMLVPHLTYLIQNAILPPSYNSSLHGNLHRNFESKFPGCHLRDFKRTTLIHASLGESFYYDLELMNDMLSYDPAWAGRKGSDGFFEEVRRANFNLSVVESQIHLFQSWKSLLVELSAPLITEIKFQKIMAVATTDCLKANSENRLPESIFERLAFSRTTLAFTLLQKLLEVKSSQNEVMRILPVAWDTLRTYNANVGDGLSGHDANYYRMLLKILYLALQVHTTSDVSFDTARPQDHDRKSPSGDNITAHVGLEIISIIVAQGFRSLTIVLHDNPQLINPSDFALLTAILRSSLHVSDVLQNPTHLLNAFSDSQTARCASTLLSWSDRLVTSGDPIYGELSVLFLLEMSSVPTLAESLAVEGALSQMLSTNLVRLLQSQAFGPFDQPMRLYNIWCRGILPFLLNLLHAVGAPLAAEVAAALNTFPHQLDRISSLFTFTSTTSTRDAHRDQITLSGASEAVTLSLIATILQTFREAGSSAGIVSSAIGEIRWDRTQVKEEAEACLQRRGALRERIVPTNEREDIWSKAEPENEGSGAENRLEEKIVEEMKTVVGILEGNSE